MRIYTNVQSLNSHRNMKVVSGNAAKSSEKLSSGMQINRAADDAAGLAISEKMRSQIKGLDRASLNAQDGISMIQTAEGALQETHQILQRMRQLVVQASNDTLLSTDRAKIQEELGQLLEEIDAISTKTQFNKRVLLDGGQSKIWLQIGANKGQGITVAMEAMNCTNLFSGGNAAGTLKTQSATDGGFSITEVTGSTIGTKLIDKIDGAIEKVSKERAKLGAIQNRLEHSIRNLDVASENLSAAESRIRDTDMAKEMMKFTQGNILTQASTSMMAQANQAPNNVLQLLG